jgi:CubicO group peptidase (beta-lactamase class C family)
MPALPLAKPDEIGLNPRQLQHLDDVVDRWVKADKLPALGLAIGRRGRMLEPRFFGRMHPDAGAPPLRPNTLFLVASITKPVTATAVMMLVERGEIRLEEPVAEYVPAFAANGKKEVTIRHLLTHTSGLPDMLPNNDQLRAAHQPLAKFIEETCASPLLFAPGTRVQYQSMGTAILGEIVRLVSGVELKEFLRKEVFEPLEMHDTSLGWQPEKKQRIAAIRISEDQQKTDWNWNSSYWLGFGAPWGGMVTSPADFARFCQMMLNGGRLGEVRILSRLTVRAMTTNQLSGMALVPEEERRCRPWGLGWKLQWPAHHNNFGDLVGPNAYGHWGATGTLCWIDPETELYCVLFTTQPQGEEGRFLTRLSNLVAAAVV